MNIFLLDLDVGFLRDPLLLYKGFLENPYEQVRYGENGKTWMMHSTRSSRCVYLCAPACMNIRIFFECMPILTKQSLCVVEHSCDNLTSCVLISCCAELKWMWARPRTRLRTLGSPIRAPTSEYSWSNHTHTASKHSKGHGENI